MTVCLVPEDWDDSLASIECTNTQYWWQMIVLSPEICFVYFSAGLHLRLWTYDTQKIQSKSHLKSNIDPMSFVRNQYCSCIWLGNRKAHHERVSKMITWCLVARRGFIKGDRSLWFAVNILSITLWSCSWLADVFWMIQGRLVAAAASRMDAYRYWQRVYEGQRVVSKAPAAAGDLSCLFLLALCMFYAWMEFRLDELWAKNFSCPKDRSAVKPLILIIIIPTQSLLER